jgi:hypothetical protein
MGRAQGIVRDLQPFAEQDPQTDLRLDVATLGRLFHQREGRTLVAGVAADVLVLTNNAYGGRLKGLSRAEVLGSDGVLPRWLKAANGLR